MVVKGLSDDPRGNQGLAFVGGISARELAILELDLLIRLEWRIMPKPEVLLNYYRSLVERSRVSIREDDNGVF